jgi:hypothetical protein
MPRRPRVEVDGGVYHVYNRVASGEAVFATSGALDRDLLRTRSPRVPPQTMFGLIGITAGRALPPKSSETARPVDALFSKRRWVVATGRLVRH